MWWTRRLGNFGNLLLTIQEKIKWANNMSEVDQHHKNEVEDKVEEMRKTIKVSDIMISLHLTNVFLLHKQIIENTFYKKYVLLMTEKIDEWNKCHHMEFFSKSIISISPCLNYSSHDHEE